MRNVFLLVTILALFAGCSTPTPTEISPNPAQAGNSDSEIEAAETIGCNSIERMANQTSSLFNYNLLAGESEQGTRERIEDFLAPLASLGAILMTFEDEIEGSELLSSLVDARESAEIAYQWAQDYVEADQQGRMREISDVAVYGAPLAVWNLDLRVAHALCVEAGHSEPDTPLSASDGPEALLDYGFWRHGTTTDDLGGVTLAWVAPATTSDSQARAVVTLLVACQPDYGLSLTPMPLSLEEPDYEPLAVGPSELEVEMSIDGVRQTWATEVLETGFTEGLYPIELSSEFRRGTQSERSRILKDSFLYLSKAEQVGLRARYENGQYSGQVSMVGIDAITEKLREYGCLST